MEPRRSKHFLAHIPTIALLVVFAMSAPLGVLFFILRAIDRDAEKKEQEQTKGRISIKEKLVEKRAVIEQRDKTERTSLEKENEKKSQRAM